MVGKQDSSKKPETKITDERSGSGLSSPALEHIVCIMFENRSFDNMLGYLYGDHGFPLIDGLQFEGLNTGKYTNSFDGKTITTHFYADINLDHVAKSPTIDPGEEYQNVNVQLYGEYVPAGNALKSAEHMVSPYNLPTVPPFNWPTDAEPTMSGFFKNYYYNIFNTNGNKPDRAFADSLQIMCSFLPRHLPVLSTLAHEFGVYDHWFSAVPTQTFPNRAFFHASTSSGMVTNWGNPDHPEVPNPLKWETDNPVRTIFNSLQSAGKSWRIYYDKSQKISMTKYINSWAFRQEEMRNHMDNIVTMEQFWDDVKSGNLPDYPFIEPRGFTYHNDMHPPLTVDLFGDKLEIPDPSDVRDGEMLLHNVYMAIRNSDTQGENKSNAMNTTLLITFDEHGGTYDHVPPPQATPPDFPVGTKMECDCKFDRLGMRVPTIVVSAYTKENTVINTPMHHSSLVATLCKKHGLNSLTKRDADAPHIGNAFNLRDDQARAGDTWPVTVPHDVPPRQSEGPFTGDTALIPLTAPARSFSRLLLAHYGEPGEEIPRNWGEAYEMLERVSKKASQQSHSR